MQNALEEWVILGRCSTDEQAKEGYSIETQIAKCKQLIDEETNAKLYKTFIDEGISGSDPIEKRPELLKLLDEARQRKFQGLAIYKADRLSRLSDEREKIVQALILYGIKIKCYSGEVLTDNSPQGEFIRKTLANIDELEVKTLAFRVKNTLGVKAESGEWKGGTPPYGMVWNSEKEYMEEIPEQIEQVKTIYNMYINDLKGIPTIRDEFNASNVPYYNKYGEIKKWNKDNITKLLKSPLYCGYQWHNNRYDKFERKKTGKKYKDKSEWKLLPAKFVTPIISKELWDKAQEIRQQRGEKAMPVTKTKWLLTGLLYCANCGSLLHGHPHWNKYVDKEGNVRKYDCSSYICNGRTSKGNSFCGCKQIAKKEIEEFVISQIKDKIQQLVVNEKNLKKISEKLLRENLKNEMQDFTVLDQELNNIDAKIKKYYSDYEKELIPAEILTPRINELNKDKELILQKKQEIQDKIGNYEEIVELALTIADSLKLWKTKFNEESNIEKQKALLLKVVDRITVNTETNEVETELKLNSYVLMGVHSPVAHHKHILKNAYELLQNLCKVS